MKKKNTGIYMIVITVLTMLVSSLLGYAFNDLNVSIYVMLCFIMMALAGIRYEQY